MLPEPLHPAIVHMPLALAVLLPIGVLVALWAVRRSDSKRAIWAVVVGLTLLLAVSARVATGTGESQEDVVEEVVSHDAIEEHEEAGEAFFLTAVVVFAISLGGLLNGRIGDVARPLTLAATVALVVAAIQVGGVRRPSRLRARRGERVRGTDLAGDRRGTRGGRPLIGRAFSRRALRPGRTVVTRCPRTVAGPRATRVDSVGRFG